MSAMSCFLTSLRLRSATILNKEQLWTGEGAAINPTGLEEFRVRAAEPVVAVSLTFSAEGAERSEPRRQLSTSQL